MPVLVQTKGTKAAVLTEVHGDIRTVLTAICTCGEESKKSQEVPQPHGRGGVWFRPTGKMGQLAPGGHAAGPSTKGIENIEYVE